MITNLLLLAVPLTFIRLYKLVVQFNPRGEIKIYPLQEK